MTKFFVAYQTEEELRKQFPLPELLPSELVSDGIHDAVISRITCPACGVRFNFDPCAPPPQVHCPECGLVAEIDRVSISPFQVVDFGAEIVEIWKN